jgi:4-hydroxythreonine-4-phosphate dehydrogenase
MSILPLAITTGEPAGIGPEIALRATLIGAQPCVLIGDCDMLQSTAGRFGLPWPPAHCEIEHVPLDHPVLPGRPDPRNARYVLRVLDRAVQACQAGQMSAIVTAPINKALIQQGGVAFSGHTEYLAAATGAPLAVMMLVGGGLRVALATTHLALSAVPAAITRGGLEAVLDILNHDLRERFGFERPRIAVAGLNPHAGESGYLGREEIDVIGPAIRDAQRRGIDADGPWPADTLFGSGRARQKDAILAMYHDQGLAPLKLASFGRAVNVTLGLPLIRTSVDHGTAYDLAGTGRADPGSLRAAIELAADLAAVAAGKAAGVIRAGS